MPKYKHARIVLVDETAGTFKLPFFLGKIHRRVFATRNYFYVTGVPKT